MRHNRESTTLRSSPRRGVATFWIIAATPVLLALFVLVTDIANLWLARVQVENAVEAGALAGANVWGDGGNTAATRLAAHSAAEALAESNLTVGQSIEVDANNGPLTNGNRLIQCSGTVLLGAYTVSGSTRSFNATLTPALPNQRACRVETSVAINSLWIGFGGPYAVRASAVAAYDPLTGTAKLVSVNSGTCD